MATHCLLCGRGLCALPLVIRTFDVNFWRAAAADPFARSKSAAARARARTSHLEMIILRSVSVGAGAVYAVTCAAAAAADTSRAAATHARCSICTSEASVKRARVRALETFMFSCDAAMLSRLFRWPTRNPIRIIRWAGITMWLSGPSADATCVRVLRGKGGVRNPRPWLKRAFPAGMFGRSVMDSVSWVLIGAAAGSDLGQLRTSVFYIYVDRHRCW